jgi:hypothetical protein
VIVSSVFGVTNPSETTRAFWKMNFTFGLAAAGPAASPPTSAAQASAARTIASRLPLPEITGGLSQGEAGSASSVEAGRR